MSAWLRKLTLAVHLTVSVGWIGAVAAYVALDVTSATSRDAATLRTAYLGMDLISRNVIVPLAIASLLTGLVISLGTKWGLFRHYWVVVSLVMTIVATVVLLVERGVIASLADVAAAPAATGADLRALSSTLPHSVGGEIVLVVVLVLNIYKPQGLTRYGWRKQQERQERTRRPSGVPRMESKLATSPEDGTAEPVRRAESDLIAPDSERRGSGTGARRWVIVVSIVAAIAVLALLVFLHLAGALGPGAH